MIKKLVTQLLSLALASLCCTAVLAQTVTVRAKFEIDGKETKKKFKIILYANGVATETRISEDGSFSLPTLNAQWVDVRLISGKYNLLYEKIYLNKLRGPLTFRVFTSRSAFDRLSDTDSKCLPGQKWRAAHDLDYGDGTTVTVTTCK